MDDLRLLVSELVTNSVLHTGLDPADLITLKICSGAGAVRVEVADHGPGFDPAPPYEPGSNGYGGRGLYLIDAISERWDVDRSGSFNRVWVEVGLHSD